VASMLTRDLLEEIHSAAQYLSWVRALIARVKQEPDGLERIRLKRGLAKELMNEALPIACWHRRTSVAASRSAFA
jgi:hypothetical protein